MATCKDCIHYEVCKDIWADENWTETTPEEIKEMFSPKGCENYKPTADVQEVKHGKWLVNEYEHEVISNPIRHYYITKLRPINYRCSLCGRLEAYQEPYCNCGAKMDGKPEVKFCYDKQNKLKSCDGCHDEDCPLR